MKKKLTSLALALVLCLSLCIPAFAANNTGTLLPCGVSMRDTVDTEEFRTATTEVNGKTFVAVYDKQNNTVTVTESQNGVVVDTTEISLNINNVESNGLLGIGKDDGTRIGYEHTFTNYEWEEYTFTGYPGVFWWLRNPGDDPDERSVYENPIDGSVYSTRIDTYVSAVNDINREEAIIGVTGALAVAAYLGSEGMIPLPELVAGITSVLESIGVTGAASAAYALSKSIDTCNTTWIELFYTT